MGLLLLQGSTDLNPRELFANNEQGLWMDTSDMTATKAGWRRNLGINTDALSGSSFTKTNANVNSSAEPAPAGYTSVFVFSEDSATGVHSVGQASTTNTLVGKVANQWNTIHFACKAKERTRVAVGSNSAGEEVIFDLSTGSIVQQGAGVTGAILSLGSGWYRCSYSRLEPSTSGVRWECRLVSTGTTFSYAGDGTSGVYISGFQFEISPTPTEYQRITDFSTEFKAAFPTHTLYQDSNGVTPCTAAGDPVGLILDQSRGGLSQIGAELVTNGGFAADSDWTKGANWTIGSGVATKTGGAANNLTQTIGSTAAAWYRISLDVTRNAGTLTVSLGTSGTTYAITATGSYTFFILAGSGTQTLTLAGDSSFAGTVDNVVVRNVPGNHAYQTTSASRPTLQTTSGLWYLSFDGSDDSLVTNSVDFSATDEMTVIAGVRKLSDAARGTVCELTATIASNNGAFHLTAPNAASATYAFESKGTLLTDGVASSVTAPLTSVISGSSDISGDSNVIRVNGTQSDSDTGDQGTGNYSNAVIYIGRRGSSSLPYNGHLYQLIVRGKTTPTGKLLEAERFVARKTGVSF